MFIGYTFEWHECTLEFATLNAVGVYFQGPENCILQSDLHPCSRANTCQHTSLSANIFLPINTVYFCIMRKQS